MSSVVDDVIEAVIGLMNATSPFAEVTRGALPSGPGITCEVDPSTTDELHMDKNSTVNLGLVINGKHANLKTLSNALNNIHAALTRATSYPSDTSWQIIDILNYTLPRIIGREDNNDWIMASSINIKFYFRGDL